MVCLAKNGSVGGEGWGIEEREERGEGKGKLCAFWGFGCGVVWFFGGALRVGWGGISKISDILVISTIVRTAITLDKPPPSPPSTPVTPQAPGPRPSPSLEMGMKERLERVSSHVRNPHF